MMKLVIRFLLLCGFICCGWYAHTSQAPAGVPGNTVEQSVQADYPVVQNDQAFVTAAPSSRIRKVADPIKATKEEDDDDDDDNFLKKHSGAGSGGIPAFYTAAVGCFSNCFAGRLPFCAHFSYISTLKCIMHCVIRI
jgi:hypothetical protein